MEGRRHVEVYRDTSVTVRVVASTTTQCDTSPAGCFAHASISPIAVIVTDAAGRHALNMQGRRVDADRLLREATDQ